MLMHRRLHLTNRLIYKAREPAAAAARVGGSPISSSRVGVNRNANTPAVNVADPGWKFLHDDTSAGIAADELLKAAG